MLQSKMSIMCKLWETDGSHLLYLCFDNITEYDPDVVFDKNAVFSPQTRGSDLYFNVMHVQIFIQQNILGP